MGKDGVTAFQAGQGRGCRAGEGKGQGRAGGNQQSLELALALKLSEAASRWRVTSREVTDLTSVFAGSWGRQKLRQGSRRQTGARS